MKKIIAAILVLCSVFAFAGCGSNDRDTINNAGWEKAKDVPFEDFLLELVESKYKEQKLDSDLAVVHAIGISQEEMESLGNNNIPVTFVVLVDGVSTYDFYMTYKDGVLVAESGKNMTLSQDYDKETVENLLSQNLKNAE